jgi:hypothetical protein
VNATVSATTFGSHTGSPLLDELVSSLVATSVVDDVTAPLEASSLVVGPTPLVLVPELVPSTLDPLVELASPDVGATIDVAGPSLVAGSVAPLALAVSRPSPPPQPTSAATAPVNKLRMPPP